MRDKKIKKLNIPIHFTLLICKPGQIYTKTIINKVINYFYHLYEKLSYVKYRYVASFTYYIDSWINTLYKSNEVINISKSIIGLSQIVSTFKRNRGYVQQVAGADLTLSRFLQRD